MPAWLSKFLPIMLNIMWKQVKRFGGVLFIGLLIFMIYSKVHGFIHNYEKTWYNKGLVAQKAIDDLRFDQWVKDHPQVTVGQGGTVNQYACQKEFKAIGIYVFGIKIGF